MPVVVGYPEAMRGDAGIPLDDEAVKQFGAVAEATAPRLYRIAMRMCGNPSDAEDLVQDTLLQAFRKWGQFEGRSAATTWLYTIAGRLCQRRHRRRAGEPARFTSLSELLPTETDPVLALPAPDEGPLDRHIRKEAERAVSAALGQIPPHFRLPLVLADIAELSTAEIAAILGLKEATVKTRIHRARLLIRRVLLEHLPGTTAPPVDHDRQVCLELLRAKQEALDRHAAFPFSGAELCARCRSLFATLDLGQQVCGLLGQGEVPDSIRQMIRAQTSPAGPSVPVSASAAVTAPARTRRRPPAMRRTSS